MVSTSILPKVADSKEVTGREEKWWYATFHNVTAMVGAGVLSLPYAMAHLGWGPGTLAMVASWCITLYTLWLMIELHECVPGTRFNRYRELGQYAFGPRLGLWIVVPQQLIVQVGCNTVYMVTGGQCLQKFAEIVWPSSIGMRQSCWICIFGSFQFVLSQMPNLNSIAIISLAAAVMSLSYSTIAWVACFTRGPTPGISYSYQPSKTPFDTMFRVFSALGQMAFAYAGHGVALEIQATIPSSTAKLSKVPMWKGTVVAYFITSLCYFPVAMIGYWVFGRDVHDNVLMAFQNLQWLIAAANLMVVVHVIGSYQVYAMPVFDTIESILITRLKLSQGIKLRLTARSAYVGTNTIIYPFYWCDISFADLLGFFGGFGFTPTSYFLPCVIWLAIKKPRRFAILWTANWVCIITGVLMMSASTIGGLRNIIADASTYRFYS